MKRPQFCKKHIFCGQKITTSLFAQKLQQNWPKQTIFLPKIRNTIFDPKWTTKLL